MKDNRNPILVTGAHRSGTTWVGRMLAADADTAYISEPLNVLHRPGVLHAPVKHWYTYITQENEAEYLPAFEELFDFEYHTWSEILSIRSLKDFLRMGRDFNIFFNGSLHGQRALLKDPFAVFSAPWFAQRLNCKVVVTVRHPAGFASSLKRLNWPFDFRNLLDQPILMRDHLEVDRAEMESIPGGRHGRAGGIAMANDLPRRSLDPSTGSGRRSACIPISSLSATRTFPATPWRGTSRCTSLLA